MALNPRQERFVAEYLVDLNATQAAIRAGYSEATAKQIGSRLLTHVDVAAAVASGGKAVVEKVAGSAEWIVEQAVRIVEMATQDRKTLAVATPALAILARRHPEFSEKHDLNVQLRAQMLGLVATMTEDELREAKLRLTEGNP